MSTPLQLRDIHLPPEPSWWPPAPGWWLLAALLVFAGVLLARALLRKRRARRRLAGLLAEFDAAAALPAPAERVAAISQMLRRAAQLRDPGAATLPGEAWLRFLDGEDAAADDQAFTRGAGRVLLDAPYRARVDAQAAEALVAPARRRFRSLVVPRSERTGVPS